MTDWQKFDNSFDLQTDLHASLFKGIKFLRLWKGSMFYTSILLVVILKHKVSRSIDYFSHCHQCTSESLRMLLIIISLDYRNYDSRPAQQFICWIQTNDIRWRCVHCRPSKRHLLSFVWLNTLWQLYLCWATFIVLWVTLWFERIDDVSFLSFIFSVGTSNNCWQKCFFKSKWTSIIIGAKNER